jgi:hypothetical protein
MERICHHDLRSGRPDHVTHVSSDSHTLRVSHEPVRKLRTATRVKGSRSCCSVPGTPGTGRQVREPLEAAQVRRGHGVISVRGLMGTPDPGEGGIVGTEDESGGDLVGCWVFLWNLGPEDWIAIRSSCRSLLCRDGCGSSGRNKLWRLWA